jgi:hypothetical protein
MKRRKVRQAVEGSHWKIARIMVDTSPILFVEPIARGFRLDVLASAISAIRERSRRPVFVVTRADFASRELARRIESSWTDVNFVASSIDLKGASAAILDGHAVGALLDAAVGVLPGAGRADFVFLGADDYLGALATQLPAYRSLLNRVRPFVFLYDTEDLVAGQLIGSGAARIAHEAIASIETLGATLIAFDERLRGQRIGVRCAKVLPDPWHGPFVRVQRRRAREAIGVGSNELLVTLDVDLLVNEFGSSWLADVERLAQMPFVRFALQGNVWTLRSQALKQLAVRLGNRLVHAGPSHQIEVDIRLIAATDLLLSRGSAPRCAGQREPVATATQACAARRVRATELGAAFDRDVRRLLLDSVDGLRGMSGVGMTLIRGELDRLADEHLNRAFGMQLRAAIRREE